MLRLSLGVLLLALLALTRGTGGDHPPINPPGDTPGGDDWKYDVIHRKRGLPLKGLIVEEGVTAVRIRCVLRKPGRPTILVPESVPRADILRMELLNREDRAVLKQRLDSLIRERDLLTARLRALVPTRKGTGQSADALDIRPAKWPTDDKVKALSYQSSYFRLVANTRRELVQLVAIQLEQVYAAYVRTLPPRHPPGGGGGAPARTPPGTPTTILLTGSLKEYQALARSRGLNLFNPAYYDPENNQIVCGSDLERLGDELEQVRAHHAKLRTTIKERRTELTRVYRGKVPAELLAPMIDAEKRIVASEKKNDATFARVRERLTRRLYHETFHAYLNSFVYPAANGSLPLWFNEGLAQVFESAIFEVGELRVGHADPERRTAVRKAIASKDPSTKLLRLADLLRSEPQHFQVAHASDQQVSDRYYLSAWALAFYLTFDRKCLGTKALDDYVAALKRGTDPLLAFRDLVGKPLADFEKDFLLYLIRLLPDGTTGSRG